MEPGSGRKRNCCPRYLRKPAVEPSHSGAKSAAVGVEPSAVRVDHVVAVIEEQRRDEPADVRASRLNGIGTGMPGSSIEQVLVEALEVVAVAELQAQPSEPQALLRGEVARAFPRA